MADGKPGELRIALTISGAISLGAYEGGALAALLVGAQRANELRPDALRIDAIAGASAGSMTAVLAARTLLAGLHPIETMYRAWVTTPQLSNLTDRLAAPLDVSHTRKQAVALLEADGDRARQTVDVQVDMALGSLHSLQYKIGRLKGAPIHANTYLDWEPVTFTAAMTAAQYTAENGPMAAALASGAHAVAFRPQPLDRSADAVRQRYIDNGIENFPPSRLLWYTDGGTIDNEPLGHALDLSEQIDLRGPDPLGEASRIHILVTPDPAEPVTGDDDWSAPKPAPRWANTLLRVLTLISSQHLYDDLRRLEKTNSRIVFTDQLQRVVAALLDDPEADPTVELERLIASFKAQKATLQTEAEARPPDDLPPASDSATAALLREAIALATGLGQKREITMAIVSPRILPQIADGTSSVHDVLAGEALHHFGGFFDPRLRENDFAWGYRSMLQWMGAGSGLESNGLEAELSAAAVAATRSEYDDWAMAELKRPWITELGRRKLSLSQRFALSRLALRTIAILLNDARRALH